MLTKFRRLLVTLAAIALPSFFTSASSASVFSSISYAHGAGVQNGKDGLGAGWSRRHDSAGFEDCKRE